MDQNGEQAGGAGAAEGGAEPEAQNGGQTGGGGAAANAEPVNPASAAAAVPQNFLACMRQLVAGQAAILQTQNALAQAQQTGARGSP